MLFKWCFFLLWQSLIWYFMLVLLDASVDFRIAGSRGVEVGSWGGAEDWGLIQWLHKWIWLIEGASDPDWCTAGAPLIGEGGVWWRESGGRRKGEHGPRRKGTPAAKVLAWQGSRQMPNAKRQYEWKRSQAWKSHADAQQSSAFRSSPQENKVLNHPVRNCF